MLEDKACVGELVEILKDMRGVLWPEPVQPHSRMKSTSRALMRFIGACSGNDTSKRMLQRISQQLQNPIVCNLGLKLRECLTVQEGAPEADSGPQEALASLIGFIKKMEFELRLAVILSALGRVRAKDDEIRRAKAELRSFVSASSGGIHSKEDEEKLASLLRQQKKETDHEHAQGMARTKEEVEDARHRAVVWSLTLDAAAEEQDQQMLERLLRAELAKVSAQAFELDKLRQQGKVQQQEGMPEVEEMIRLHEAKGRLLQQRLVRLRTEHRQLQESGRDLQTQMNASDTDRQVTQRGLVALYTELAKLIQQWKQELQKQAKLKRDMKSKVEDRLSNLGDEIYRFVGGVMNPDGSQRTYEKGRYPAKPHKKCEEAVRQWANDDSSGAPPCHYLGAVKRGTAFVVTEMRNGNRNVEQLQKGIIKHLKDVGFGHSHHDHEDDLKRIVKYVDVNWDKMQREIEADRTKYTNLIEEAEQEINRLREECATTTTEIQRKEIRFNLSGKEEKQKLLEAKYHDRDSRASTELVEESTKLSEKSQNRLESLQDIKEGYKQKIDDQVDKISECQQKISDLKAKVKDADEPFLPQKELIAARCKFADAERTISAVGLGQREQNDLQDRKEQLEEEVKKSLARIEALEQNTKTLQRDADAAQQKVDHATQSYQACLQKRSELDQARSARFSFSFLPRATWTVG